MMVYSNRPGSLTRTYISEKIRDAGVSRPATKRAAKRRSNRALLMLQAVLLLLACCVPFKAGLAQDNVLGNFLTWPSDLEVRRTYFYSSFYTRHYDPDPDHVNDQNMFGFEAQLKNRRVMGLAVFDNSFGQTSEYAYIGEHWSPFSSEKVYLKLTGGLLHGYKEPYEDKIPLNDLGIAPAIVPTVGYRSKNFTAEFNQLGFAAAMITAGFTF